MKESSKKNTKIILILLVVFIAASILGYTISKYFEAKRGNLTLSVAKPICNLVVENEDFSISNTEKSSLYFTVNNFEDKEVSDVGMKYNVTFEFPEKFVTANVLDYTLYKVNSDNTEETVQTVNSTFKADTKESQKYKLEMIYNSSSPTASDITEEDLNNFNIEINLNSEQVKP